MTKTELINNIFYKDYRECWLRTEVIEKFNNEQKSGAETILIEMLGSDKGNFLVYEALAQLKSNKALPGLYALLNDQGIENFSKLVLAVCIYQIDGNEQMVDAAIRYCKAYTNKYDIIRALGYLKKMDSEEAGNTIREYVDYPDFLVAYNAKRHLGLVS